MTSSFSKLLAHEKQWMRCISSGSTIAGAGRLLTLYGPTGVGKTTIASALISKCRVYIEDIGENPYLSFWLNRKGRFNAKANQSWFLERVSHFAAQCDSTKTLVLDQDPAAIVLVYSRLFLDDGLITIDSYEELIGQLIDLEKHLQSWRIPRTVIYLDEPEEVLFQRIARRQKGGNPQPLEWFRRLRLRFRELFYLFPEGIDCAAKKISAQEYLQGIN